jgi:hypothetical protein
MTKPMIRIYDVATGETIDREMTAAEFEQYTAGIEAKAKADAEIATKATAKAALLAKLGITVEEAALLLG